MIAWLIVSCVLVVLAILNGVQYMRNRRMQQHIRNIQQQLHTIRKHTREETLLLPTQHDAIKQLLTEINHMMDAQTAKRVEFRRRERAIQTMLANISHDLKTPLTVVLGYIETLQNDPDMDRDEQNRLYGQMKDKTRDIIDMMNTFFDVAKLEAGDTSMPLERVNVTEIAKQSLLSFYDLIQNQQLEPVIDIPDEAVWVHGNEEALGRIMENLLSNAIRYGMDGGVVGVTLTQDGNHVRIAIWDRGRGIPEALQDHIFDRMFTVEESRNKSFQGSGLGLFITKRLAQEMNGTIALTSTPFQLTVFEITFKRLTY